MLCPAEQSVWLVGDLVVGHPWVPGQSTRSAHLRGASASHPQMLIKCTFVSIVQVGLRHQKALRSSLLFPKTVEFYRKDHPTLVINERQVMALS